MGCGASAPVPEASPAHSASGNAAAVVAGKDTSARERLPPAAGPRAQVKFDVLEERSGDGAAGGIGALGGDASSKASSRVESRAASQVAFERLPEKDEALGNVASPSLSDPIGVAVERAEVMGSDEDNEDARDSPLMRRMTTKKRSEARMVRAPDIPTIETGSGQFDSGRMAEITAAAKKEAAERKLLEARSLQLAQKLAAEDEDEEEDESNSVSFGAWGRGGGGGGSAAPAAGASGRGRGGASSGRSRLAEVVGSTDAVNLGSASISSEDRGPPPLPPLQPLQPASRGKRGGFADDDTLRLSGAAAALLKMEHADDLNDSNDLSSLAPPSMGGPTPAPSGKLALSTRPSRYTDLSFSDSDDEDGGKPFDLPRWRKFYAWNRNKQADLTEFLWRRFDPRTNSMFVVTYAAQDAIFAGYQGDNAMHGMACRLEEHLDGQMDLFGIIHTYLDHETGAYKVLGLMITDGTDVPPQLRRMPDFDAFHFNKVADTRNPTIRKFVGSLLAGDGPTAALGVICSREISLQRKH